MLRPQSKIAAASVPHMPGAPWTANASIGSSTFIFFTRREETSYMMPPTTAIMKELPHSTLPHPAVIETRPARMPLQKPAMSYFFDVPRRHKKTVMPPTAAATVVFIATWAAMKPRSIDAFRVPQTAGSSQSWLIPNVEPQLKPYHPNQRTIVPRTMRGKLCGWKASSGPSQRPLRGPAMLAPTRAAMPPVMCTIPEPAKSMKPVRVTVARKP
mmetsp:Transcript_26318/g.62754  ORF Transcript_26318/g.62754 Transcript_26318/m.62754 type:complete len:213 (-) Transcript_26318:415-1053(-)